MVGRQSHILMQHETPKVRPHTCKLETGRDYVCTVPLWDNWQDLLEITSQDDWDAAEWAVTMGQMGADILQRSIHSIKDHLADHRSLIPDDQAGTAEQLSKMGPPREKAG